MTDKKCKICKGQLIGRVDKQTCSQACRSKLTKLNRQKAYNKLVCELIAS